MTAIKNMENEKHDSKEKKAEETMRILANFLIDRFLDDVKNNRLQSILNHTTINFRANKQ